MNPKFLPLFQPLTIRGQTFKNRILGGPLGNNQSNPGAEIIQENVDYYGALARGGAARIVGGGDAVVNPDGGYMGGMGRVKFFVPMNGDFSASIRNFVNTIHRYNCLAFVQLTYDGGPTGLEPFVFPGKNLGPSDITHANGARVVGMTPQDMEGLKKDFADCAAKAASLGVDGIIIHAGHGKLLDQFRARDFNHRTDEYGGSVENRSRYPREILSAVRRAIGPRVLLEYRTSVEEYVPNGITLDESIRFFQLLEEDGTVDLFHITSGRHTDALNNAYCISPATFPQAPNREYCRQIKAAGIRTPLVIVNSCANPDTAADIIASGDADFVNLSRQINLADPYYPRKLHEGNEDLVDNCLRCHGCYDVVGPCSVNPCASFKTYESSYPLKKAPVSKTVWVAGGGIAGLKAAHTAAERGHQVVLLEQSDHLGGQLVFSDSDTIKTDIRYYKDHMIRRVIHHPGIRVRLNTRVTPKLVEEGTPQALIIALGSVPNIPDIPGVQGKHVLTALQAYAHPELVRGHVVMLGSGLTACEMALHLNNLGHSVSIVGRRERICYHESFDVMPTALYNPVPTFLKWFDQRGIRVYNHQDAREITPEGVMLYHTRTGEGQLLSADTVILSAGMRPLTDQAYALMNTAPFTAMAGDCIRPKKIRDAVFTAYWNAMEI